MAQLCRVMNVSRSGFYDWQRRRECPSPRNRASLTITDFLRRLHHKHRGWYGSRRLRRALRDDYGVLVGRNRVRRLMQEGHLCTRRPKRYKKTTDSSHKMPTAPNRLNRNFSTSAPNQVWVGDITYIRTKQGWLYLSVLLDLFSRRVVGWSMSCSLERKLCLDTLEMAVRRRNPKPGLIHHSDRGCQYASADYQDKLASKQIVCSMSRAGDCWDNAVAESFFATLKSELLYRARFETVQEAREAIFEYIEIYYNRERYHSVNGYRTPEQAEREYRMPKKAA